MDIGIRVEAMGKGIQEVEQTALQSAAASGEAAIGNILADRGAEVDFYGAAFLDRADKVSRYLREGTTVDLEDGFGMTALNRALQGNAISVILFLIENEAEVSKPADTFSTTSVSCPMNNMK